MLFERVLYPIDMRKASLGVKPYILKLREAGCREVHLLYVILPSEWGFVAREEYDSEEKIEALRGAIDDGYVDGLIRIFRKMKEIAKEFEDNGIETKVVLIPGELDETISYYTDQYRVKLVTLGITDESLSFFRVGKLLDIIKSVKSPILVVKTEEKEGSQKIE